MNMKSAYELAMERLNKSQPKITLTEQQKAEISEIDNKFKAKIAEREVFLSPKIEEARSQGDFETAEQLEKQLSADKSNLECDMETAKQKVRDQGS